MGKYVTMNGMQCLDMASHNYLGFSGNPQVEQAAANTIRQAAEILSLNLYKYDKVGRTDTLQMSPHPTTTTLCRVATLVCPVSYT